MKVFQAAQRKAPNKVNAAIEMERAREGRDVSEAGTHAEMKGKSEALLNMRKCRRVEAKRNASTKSTTIGTEGQK